MVFETCLFDMGSIYINTCSTIPASEVEYNFKNLPVPYGTTAVVGSTIFCVHFFRFFEEKNGQIAHVFNFQFNFRCRDCRARVNVNATHLKKLFSKPLIHVGSVREY